MYQASREVCRVELCGPPPQAMVLFACEITGHRTLVASNELAMQLIPHTHRQRMDSRGKELCEWVGVHKCVCVCVCVCVRLCCVRA